MYAHPGAAVEAAIEAENLLVLAGLKRIAAQVGIAEAADPAIRDLTLRSGTSRPSPFGIDVAYSDSTVTVTVARQPSRELWAAIFELIAYLVPSKAARSDTQQIATSE